DAIEIHVYGDRNKDYNLEVKNDGTVDLAFIGPVKIGGLEFQEAKRYLVKRLRSHFKLSDFNINIQKYSTIQVTLIGEVKNPGLYNLSSFSTVKDLLITAKGVMDSASVREIVVKRDSKTIAKFDFYDLLFKGKKFATQLLKHGDIVVIKKANRLVSIDGYVSHSAIFELNEGEHLDKLIKYAGGMKPNASKLNIKIDRYSENSKTETFHVSYAKAKKFRVQDGDRVYIYPLDFTAQSSVNVYGNIIRPGSYRLTKDSTLNSFLKVALKNGKEKFFLPDTYFEYGVVKSYSQELEYKTKSFNLKDVLNGLEKVKLHPKDQIFIFNKADIFSSSYVITKGSNLIKAGKLQFIEGMTIADAVNASGIDGVLDDKIRVTTYNTDDFMPKTDFYSLEQEGDTVLSAYDELEVYDYYSKHILEPVSIAGQVVNPTSVYYEKGMNLEKLLEIAGGYTKKAYTNSLTIIRYSVDDTLTRNQKVLNIDLTKTTLKDIELKPYDEVRISSILGWNSQDYETVTISGEVHTPLTIKYGKGLTLKDLTIIADGLTPRAYTKEVEIVRYFVDENMTRQREIIKIDLEKNELDDVALKAYDEVRIFKIPNWNEKESVTLGGEVKFPGRYIISSGEKLSSVIKRAGGFTKDAFIEGAVFTRDSIRKSQTANYNKSLARIKRQLAIYNAMPANAKTSVANVQASNALNEVIDEAKKYQPLGRVSVVLDSNITEIENSPYDLVLKDKDTLRIPSQIDTVTVFGEVFNPTSFVFNAEYDSEEYIELASGLTRAADGSSIYVIHADGTSEPIDSGWFSSNIDIAKGDTIVVPIYIKEYNTLEIWDSVAKILSSFALTAAAVNSLGII
ncbi:MAG: SLBB domain-containing protein, partial [Campylobacterota bacterium]|nr:SLBB domain-containing protein [Campylobacterota bacterium]